MQAPSKAIIMAMAVVAVAIQWRLHSINVWPVSAPLPPLPDFSFHDSRLSGNIEKIGIDDLIGPESLIVSKSSVTGKDVMFASLSDGRIVRMEEQDNDLSWTDMVRTGSVPLSDKTTCGKGGPADTTHTEPICGRPLGMRMVKRSSIDASHSAEEEEDGDEDVLVIADSPTGLLMVTGVYGDPGEATVHTLATRSNSDPENYSFQLLNGVIQTPDGALYFTETSQQFQRRRIFHAVIDGKSTGRLLRYTKDNGVEVLVDGLYIPNGIALSHDGTHLVFVSGIQVLTYSLETQAMESDPLIYVMPGTGDNVDAKSHLPSGAKRDCYWLGLGSKFSLPFSLLKTISDKPLLKAILVALVPYKNFVDLIPKFSALAVYDVSGEFIEMYRDENATAPWLSEGEIMGEYLYLASWYNNFLARVRVDKLIN